MESNPSQLDFLGILHLDVNWYYLLYNEFRLCSDSSSLIKVSTEDSKTLNFDSKFGLYGLQGPEVHMDSEHPSVRCFK